MASCVNALSYSSIDTSRGIDPTMHVINSLGLPKPGGYASANYFSSTKPINPSSISAPDKVSGFTFSKQNSENIGNLNYETAYSPKTYRPSSAYSFNSSSNKSGSLDPMGYGIVRSYSQMSQEGKKSRKSGGSSENGVDPDENNNFMRDHRGRFCQCPDRVCERNPSERICQLAQPKRLPCAYQEDRCIYWTYKRMRPNCGNHTHFETTPRLDELAMPKPLIVDCCASHTSCDMSCFCHAHPIGETDPRCVDWDRLAAPKVRCPANYRPIQHVRKSALKAEPTKRLCKLSAPKPVIDVAKFYLWLWQKKPDTKIQLTKVVRLFITKCHLTDMRVMVRCDLDPSTGGGLEAKLAAVIPTIKYILAKGAKSVIIVSNCPPPKLPGSNLPDMKAASLKPLTARFQELLATNVLFLDDCVGYQAKALCQDPEPGNVFLLENLAFHPEETGKGIDDKGQEYVCPKEKVETFRKEFFHLADTYVIETFRELVNMTNSTVGFPNQDKAYGFKVKTELDNYNLFVSRPYQPMVAIVGGPIKDTFLIIRNLMGIATDIVVGGETALVFLRALKRTDLGRINITPKMEKKALNLHARAKDTKTGLLLPSDVVVKHMQSGQFYTVLTREDVDNDYEIVDIGPFTRKCYIKVIQKAETLLWWGDMGSLGDGTSAIAAAFVEAAQRGARTYVAENTSGATIVNTSEWGTKTRVTEDSVATTMLLKGKLPKGLAGLNPYRRKIKKREPASPPISRKPIKYDIPGMEIPSGEKIMCISDISLEGKNVLIRLDTNVQMQGNKVLNNYHIRMAVPTIKYALKWRARTVVIMGHLGIPDGKREDSLSLKPICDELASLLGYTVVFVPETVGKQAEAAIASAHSGTVIMLENVRFNLEETGSGTSKGGLMWKSTRAEATPQGIATFCEKMSRLGDVYVNDAFPCAIYDHSSITSFYQPTRVCGFLMKNELKYMARICNFPQRRLLVVLGGNSFKEKIPILRDLMREADDIILVGAIGVAFLKVYLNTSIGSSMYDPSYEQDIRSIIDLADYYSCRLFYPVDLTIASNKNGDNLKQVSITEQIPEGQMVIDIGDLTSSMFGRLISKSKMVFWVGTAGIAETEAGSKGSKKIMEAMIDATSNPEAGIISIIGGHSTCGFVHKFKTGHDSFTHMSTGSIAAFKLLTDRYLSGIDKLMPKPRNRPLRLLGVDQVDVTDKRVLLRADLVVPIVDEKVVDTFPLTQLVATVKYLLKKGVRSVVILGSRGEPEGKVNPELSLLPLKEVLEELLEQEVYFAEDGVSELTEAASKTRRLILVENVKFHPEEAGIKEDPNGVKIKVAYNVLETFRARMTSLGDIYVNESLCSLHLKYSSLVGIGNIQKVAGLNLKRTLLKFEEIKKNLEKPVLAILGGNDPQNDLSRLFDLLDSVDEVILCGDLGLTILKAETGAKLGKFKYDPGASKLIPKVLSKARVNNISLHLPVDLVADEEPKDLVSKVATPVAAASGVREGTQPASRDERVTLFNVSVGIPDEYMPLDIGAETISIFTDIILQAKTILLHGVITPFYTFHKYQDGSKAILDAIQSATANGSQSVAMGSRAMCLINKLNYTDSFTLCDHGVQIFWDMLRGRSLPGLQILEDAPGRPLKKLSMEQMDLTNLRVLMRLDLFVPTVEGVVIDTDKLEEAAPTILLALKKGAKCVVLLGHRGNPNGYKNNYLSMKPLLVDLSQILERPVTMIDRPCSKKAKKLLADPEPGSVFLMENLKFYPAEYGIDAEPRESRSKRGDMDVPGDAAETKDADQDAEAAAEKEDEQESSSVTLSTETISDGEGGKNIDSVMFQLMTPKTVAEFNADLAQCGDVFISDDLTDIAETLTSLQGFGLPQRGCGLQLASYLSEMDDPEVYNLPGVASLSPAPR